MPKVIPILRIFDYTKAVEFYINWLGFKIDWEYKPGNTPVYMQVSQGDILIQLSEHHGDVTPGSGVYIEEYTGLPAYHQQLLAKDYKFMKPGISPASWDPATLNMEVIDPFGNRLTFNGK